MKKLLTLLLVAVFLLSLTACKKTPTSEASSEPTDTIVSNDNETVSETVESETTSGTTESSDKNESHTHSFAAATCIAPKTCTVCKVTEGSALGHKFSDATCTAPKSCTVCQATEGSALGHNFSEATCEIPKTCSVCKATEGSAAAHKYSLGKCSVCGATDPAVASLLSSACYGTYEVLFKEAKDGLSNQVIRSTIKYNSPTSIEYKSVQYSECDASEADIEFGGKYYQKWHEASYSAQNIQITENSLSFKYGDLGYGCDLEYKDGALYGIDYDSGAVIEYKRIA